MWSPVPICVDTLKHYPAKPHDLPFSYAFRQRIFFRANPVLAGRPVSISWLSTFAFCFSMHVCVRPLLFPKAGTLRPSCCYVCTCPLVRSQSHQLSWTSFHARSHVPSIIQLVPPNSFHFMSIVEPEPSILIHGFHIYPLFSLQ